MDGEAATHASTLDASMARARTITLIMAHNAAFRGFYLAARQPRVEAAPRLHRTSTAPTTPSSTWKACSPTRSASCASSTAAVRRTPASCTEARAPVSDLSPDEASNPFFGPTFALRPGQVFQSKPYVSPDTHDWVIGNATPIPLGAQRRSVAIVHYELSVESFRRELRADDDEYALHARRRPHRPRGHRQLAPPEGRGAARRARRPPLRRPGASRRLERA